MFQRGGGVSSELRERCEYLTSCHPVSSQTKHVLFPVQDLNCFLVDNNGFVVLSKDRSEVRPRPPRPQQVATGNRCTGGSEAPVFSGRSLLRRGGRLGDGVAHQDGHVQEVSAEDEELGSAFLSFILLSSPQGGAV